MRPAVRVAPDPADRAVPVTQVGRAVPVGTATAAATAADTAVMAPGDTTPEVLTIPEDRANPVGTAREGTIPVGRGDRASPAVTIRAGPVIPADTTPALLRPGRRPVARLRIAADRRTRDRQEAVDQAVEAPTPAAAIREVAPPEAPVTRNALRLNRF